MDYERLLQAAVLMMNLAQDLKDAWDCGYPVEDPNHNFHEDLMLARMLVSELEQMEEGRLQEAFNKLAAEGYERGLVKEQE